MSRISILYLFAFLLLTKQAAAQAGFYRAGSKDEGETLELRSNGTFTYHIFTPFSKSSSEGKWQTKGDKIILHGDKQVQFKVMERLNPDVADLQIIFEAPDVEQGARQIEKVLLNDKGKFYKNNDRALQYLEERSRLNASGTQFQRDSIRTAYVPQHYICSDYDGEAQKISVFFDKKVIHHLVQNPSANDFLLVFLLDPNGLTRYFDQEEWTWTKKELLSPQNTVFKKGKK